MRLSGLDSHKYFVRTYIYKFNDSLLTLWIEVNFAAQHRRHGLDSQSSFVVLLSRADSGVALVWSTAQEVQRISTCCVT
jgi:hypothetical protein